MRISCIIPTCNRKEYLIDSLGSVINQTRAPDEIIIINNGIEKIKLPCEIMKKVSVYDIIPFAGASQARNFGAIFAKGEYLAFLDDDDFWSSEYLKNVSDALSEGNECVISRLDKIQSGKISKYKNSYQKLNIKNLFIFNPGVTGSNIVIKKDIFVKLGGFDIRLVTSEDKSLIIDAIINNVRIKVLPENQAIFRTDILRKGLGENSEKMSEGIRCFLYKYSKLMTLKERLLNYLKIHKYRFQSGSVFSLIPFLFLYLLKKIKII